MKILELITERRRESDHPAQARHGVNVFKKYRDMPEDAIKNLYVTFTHMDKVGINPKSPYNTPLGIYTYPMEYVLRHRMNSNLPFAGEAKFAWVVKPASGSSILHLQNYTQEEYDNHFTKKLVPWMKSVLKIGEDAIEYLQKKAKWDARASTPGGMIWYMAYTLSGMYYEKIGGSQSVAFNHILRKVLGYDIAIDNGQGIIHPNEETQAVFLTKATCEVVEQVRNNNKSLSVDSDAVKQLIRDPDRIFLKNHSGGVAYVILREPRHMGDEFIDVQTLNNIRTYDTYTLNEIVRRYGSLVHGRFEKFNRSQFKKLSKHLTDPVLIKDLKEVFANKIESVMDMHARDQVFPNSLKSFGIVKFVADIFGQPTAEQWCEEVLKANNVQ